MESITIFTAKFEIKKSTKWLPKSDRIWRINTPKCIFYGSLCRFGDRLTCINYVEYQMLWFMLFGIAFPSIVLDILFEPF